MGKTTHYMRKTHMKLMPKLRGSELIGGLWNEKF